MEMLLMVHLMDELAGGSLEDMAFYQFSWHGINEEVATGTHLAVRVESCKSDCSYYGMS